MEIVRNADGTLVVPVQPERQHETDSGTDAASTSSDSSDGEATPRQTAPSQPSETRLLHPGEGGYDEASPSGIGNRTPIVNQSSPRRADGRKP